MIWILLVCSVLWIYLLTVFHRGKMYFFHFLFGSVGLFLLMLVTIQPQFTDFLIKTVTASVGFVGSKLSICQGYSQYGLLFLPSDLFPNPIVLSVSFECSAVMEIMVFISLVSFFPLYKVKTRILLCLIGSLSIFTFNMIRLLVVCGIVKLCGVDYFFLAHAIIGRFVFFALTVALYFYVFTRSQIVNQKVGGFSYGKS